MKPGRYAAADGSFGRSAGVAMGRGVLLLALALVVGIVLLNATSNDPPGTRVSTASSSESTTKPTGKQAVVTTTTLPPTTTVPAHNPKDVKVLVANGSGTSGVAGNASTPLKNAGFNVLAPANADKAQESAVYFVAGYDKDAADIATALALPATAAKAMPSPAPVKSDANPNIIVVVGSADAARFAQATGTTSASKSTTATTTASATRAVTATTTTAKPAATATTTAKPATTTTTVKR